MKRCPSCNRTYTDLSLNFCLEDGTPLVTDVSPAADPHATVRYPPIRDTGEPPPTEIYRQPMPVLNQVPEMTRPQQQQWSAAPVPPQKKSNAVWWVLGGLAVIGIIGIGLVVMIIALASLGTDANSNSNGNSNSAVRTVNRNSAINTNRTNTNSSSSAASLTDDFSDQKWGASKSQYGDTWYEDDEYHMRSKEKTFVVMYAPGNDYNTENATVRVRARSVDGDAATSGYGLIVHGKRKNSNQLEDYGLLIYTGDQPQYQIVMHKDGSQIPLVAWTRSAIIRSGTSPNQLEARIDGDQISFYINGQYVNRITDKENFKNGLVGLYTSDTAEVAFDDLEIIRN